jgi:hypothetical protein
MHIYQNDIVMQGEIKFVGPVSLKAEDASVVLDGKVHAQHELNIEGQNVEFSQDLLMSGGDVCIIAQKGLVHFKGKVDGNYKLNVDAIDASVIFDDALGESVFLADLAVRGQNIRLGKSIFVDGGNITFDGPVQLSDTLFVSSGEGSIYFSDTLDAMLNEGLFIHAPIGVCSMLGRDSPLHF